METRLKNGMWLIRMMTFILCKWSPNANLSKEDFRSVLVWVKFNDIPITAFMDDGLSAIATKLGTSLMLDVYTTTMCTEALGRSSYETALIGL